MFGFYRAVVFNILVHSCHQPVEDTFNQVLRSRILLLFNLKKAGIKTRYLSISLGILNFLSEDVIQSTGYTQPKFQIFMDNCMVHYYYVGLCHEIEGIDPTCLV